MCLTTHITDDLALSYLMAANGAWLMQMTGAGRGMPFRATILRMEAIRTGGALIHAASLWSPGNTRPAGLSPPPMDSMVAE
jgi:hypothetical protein